MLGAKHLHPEHVEEEVACFLAEDESFEDEVIPEPISQGFGVGVARVVFPPLLGEPDELVGVDQSISQVPDMPYLSVRGHRLHLRRGTVMPKRSLVLNLSQS